MSQPRVLDARGRAVGLGGEVARGGEGVVFDLLGQPERVAKIYLKPPDRDRAEKVAAMVAMATERLTALSAWPLATLHSPGGDLAGFVMPKLAGYRPVFQVYGPKLRLKQFPKADWRFLVHAAGNVARGFGVMHAHGLVVGDVNHGNLFVAPRDATVRFIDADSMQVTRGSRRWPCEVGVGTHQPPEMQGLASYRDVVRTPNHDNFGLAVLIFQMLCMGRHPFSGRYAGRGEPPDIERAIAECRYAYSADGRRTQMSPAPGSLPIAALPGGIQALFEAAFAPAAMRGGRPDADRWTAELAGLGGLLRRCADNAAHWYASVAGSCPWCEVEARSGVALFPSVFVGRREGGGIELLWQAIEAVEDPGPLPALQPPKARAARPSARVNSARRRILRRRAVAAGVLASGIALVLAFVPAADRAVPVLAVVALAAWVWFARRPPEAVAAQVKLAEISALWDGLGAKWRPGPAAKFAATRQALAALKREHDAMPARRERELRALTSRRREQQLQVLLESFEIATARISGIGKAKVATLLSYGIETAADIDQARIEAVPGFGPKTVASLVAFRRDCEAGFRFNAAESVSSSVVAAMDGMLAQRRAKIEAELSTGLAQLKAIVAAETRHRAALEATAAELRPLYAQAMADARALRVGRR